MNTKGLAVALGLGAVVGAVAVLAMPRNNPARKLAAKAADKVDDLAWKVTDKMAREMDMDM